MRAFFHASCSTATTEAKTGDELAIHGVMMVLSAHTRVLIHWLATGHCGLTPKSKIQYPTCGKVRFRRIFFVHVF